MAERIQRLKKGERVPSLYGRVNVYITHEDVDALTKGRTLYVNVFDEYAVAVRYKKGKDDEIDRR